MCPKLLNDPLNDWMGMMIFLLWGVQIRRKKKGSVAVAATTLPPPPTTVSSVGLNSPSFLGPFIQQKLMLINLIKKDPFLSNSDYTLHMYIKIFSCGSP